MNNLDEIIDTLKLMNSRLDKIESIISKQNVTIHIDHVNVTEPSLKELVFNIETVDVKENSGSLNIGTTFNPQVVQQKKEEKNKKKEKKKEKKSKPNEITISINGKEKDYIIEGGS